MKGRRWNRSTLKTNEGKPLTVWELKGYCLLLNINHGKAPPIPRAGKRDRHGDYWWFEVLDGGTHGRLVGEAPSLRAAKEMAYREETKA